MMLKHLQEYIIHQPHHKFVFTEKRNECAEALFNSLNKTGWKNVIYYDNYVTLATNEKYKRIILITHSTMEIENNKVFSLFDSFKKEDEDIKIYCGILISIDYSEKSKQFKIPEFINWFLSTVSICLNYINRVKIFMKNYNKGTLNYIETGKEFLSIEKSLQKDVDNLEKSIYEEKERKYIC